MKKILFLIIICLSSFAAKGQNQNPLLRYAWECSSPSITSEDSVWWEVSQEEYEAMEAIWETYQKQKFWWREAKKDSTIHNPNSISIPAIELKFEKASQPKSILGLEIKPTEVGKRFTYFLFDNKTKRYD